MGASIEIGGKVKDNFYWPTVLSDVKENMKIVSNETFGPIAPIIEAKDIDAAIQIANNSKYGLNAGVFTENIDSEMTFELPFTYPSSNVKCTVDKATKGETTDITCKMQKVKKFSVFKSFVLQPKKKKKKRKEMLFIEKINMDLLKEYKCESFNELSLKRAKARKDSPFSFLQIGMPLGFTKLLKSIICIKSFCFISSS